MLTLDQRLIIGLKALQRPSQRSPSPSRLAVERPAQAEDPDGLLSLEALFERVGEMPPNSMLLGVCDEDLPQHGGLPFVIDLIDPAPGSLLITGDPGSGKTRLLRAILASAACQNPPDQAAFYLVAHQPAQFSDIGHLDHCRLVMQTFDKSLASVVQELADLAEERRRERFAGPAVILAIDDLASALLSLDEFAFTLLYWLIHHGPRSRIWTLATLSTRRIDDLDLRFLAAFRSRLVGHIAEPGQVQTLSGSQDLPAWELKKGQQFYLPYEAQWLRFRICEPQSLRAL